MPTRGNIMPSAKPRPKRKQQGRSGERGGKPLVIVESPAKQRTISRILDDAYEVRSSYGHVRDLPANKLGVDEKKDFEPTYVLLPRTKKILPELKKLADNASAVYLATDHDREGESIAWHLVHILGLSQAKALRITFHEITPRAIQEAVKSPRGIDSNLVQAQQARRILDRLVGYKLSPLLWKKVRRGLSAGRVQSVAVRLLVERDREIKEFHSEVYWTLKASLGAEGASSPFDARLIEWRGEKIETVRVYTLFSEPYRVRSTRFGAREEIEAVMAAVSAAPFVVEGVERKELRRGPAPPFITSTLQQAASQRHGFAAERTMRVAQSLYEGVDIGGGEPSGLITYMRTDSFAVAGEAQRAARRFIQDSYGPQYLPEKPPVYRTKSRTAQEAHEAIRPTSADRRPEELARFLEPDQARLYALIWKRFMSSQAADAVYDTVTADLRSAEALFRVAGRTLKFDGFLRIWEEGERKARSDSEPDSDAAEEPEGHGGELPSLAPGMPLKLIRLEPEEHQTGPPPRYNEASLIRALEKHGIGRPSTYAPTIKTVVERGYVRNGLKDRTLAPSDLGILVTEKLKLHFPEVVNLSYTAEVEDRLDRVAEGEERWQLVVRSFYDPFHKELREAAVAMEDIKPQESNDPCPLCGVLMLIRESRFGRYLSCPKFPQCKGKVRLSESGEKVVPQITEDPCDLCGKWMVIRMGRRGKFLACSGYPACKNTYSLDADGNKIAGSRPVITSRKCEKCGSVFWLRLGKRGHFLACSGFPKCRNIKPVSKEEAEALKGAEGAEASKPGSGAS